ncbi:MAG: tRNA (5-methylaminomethyl-2-thiouridine)(34)-methyltransferase MnmD [Pseudomonadota bacterium]
MVIRDPATENEPGLDWRDGHVPVSRRFDDPYYSLENGLAEARHVFLGGNDIPARLVDRFHVAELGFGTGLNLLVTLAAWRSTGRSGSLRYTSFEVFPLSVQDMCRALTAFGEHTALIAEILDHWTPCGMRLPDLSFDLIVGDARVTLPAWTEQADAWFLDGFAPAKNPELWGAEILNAVASHTRPGGTAATYSAAGFVRRGLADAGFDVRRVPGYGRKRHMTVAFKASDLPA